MFLSTFHVVLFTFQYLLFYSLLLLKFLQTKLSIYQSIFFYSNILPYVNSYYPNFIISHILWCIVLIYLASLIIMIELYYNIRVNLFTVKFFKDNLVLATIILSLILYIPLCIVVACIVSILQKSHLHLKAIHLRLLCDNKYII